MVFGSALMVISSLAPKVGTFIAFVETALEAFIPTIDALRLDLYCPLDSFKLVLVLKDSLWEIAPYFYCVSPAACAVDQLKSFWLTLLL